MATDAFCRMDSSFNISPGFESIESGRIVPSISMSFAWMKTHGLPASMQVASTPSSVSVMFPVGNNFPVLEPLQSVRLKVHLEV